MLNYLTWQSSVSSILQYVAVFVSEKRYLCKRLFSTKWSIPRGAEFFFVCELSGRTKSKKTTTNSAPRGIFRLVENNLNVAVQWSTDFIALKVVTPPFW